MAEKAPRPGNSLPTHRSRRCRPDHRSAGEFTDPNNWMVPTWSRRCGGRRRRIATANVDTWICTDGNDWANTTNWSAGFAPGTAGITEGLIPSDSSLSRRSYSDITLDGITLTVQSGAEIDVASRVILTLDDGTSISGGTLGRQRQHPRYRKRLDRLQRHP